MKLIKIFIYDKVNSMKKYSRRKISLILALGFVLGLTACGSDSSQSKLSGSKNVQKTIDDQIAKENGSEDNSSDDENVSAGADDNESVKADASNTESDELQEPTTEEQTSEEKANESTEAAKEAKVEAPQNDATATNAKADPNVDIDMTVMNSDMVYATVYQMMSTPEQYVGMRVKVAGTYYAGQDEESKIYYHFVLINDALACCQQGLEFVWDDGSHVYPDEYPAENSDVEVVGTFEVYKDDPDAPYQYCRLSDATLTVESNGESKN